MSWETWGPPIVVLLSAMVVGLAIALRLRPGEPPGQAARNRHLTTYKDDLLRQLKSLEADRHKLDDAAFTDQHNELLDKAADTLRELEQEDPPPTSAPPSPPQRAPWMWALGVVAFAGLLAASLGQFTKPRAEGDPLTGGIPEAIPAQLQIPIQVLEEDPNDIEALNAMAHHALVTGDLGQAMSYLDRAKAVDPDNPEVLTHLAILQMSVGMTDRARAALDQALATDPRLAEALVWRSALQLRAGEIEEAKASLDQAQGLDARPEVKAMAAQLAADLANGGASIAPSEAPTHPSVAADAPKATGAARVEGTVVLADGLSVPDGGRLFIYARRAEQGGGPPIAALRRASSELPLTFTITDADMMLGGTWPESFWIQARIDADGNAATRGDGDLETQVVGPLSPGAQGVTLVLGSTP